MADYCMKCEKELRHDEVALHRKLVMRGATEYMCLECLAEHFNVSTELLEDRIRYFKETGCALF